MKKTLPLLAVALVLCAGFAACCRYGESITETVAEDRMLPLDEFKRLFREEDLNSKCFWYFGARDGYSYVEIDEPKPIDERNAEFNRRVHHTLRRFRIAESAVTFSPATPFAGYDKGKRIVAPRFADAACVTYEVKGESDTSRP